MHLQISGNPEGEADENIPEPCPPTSAISQPETALFCLAKVSAHHGVDLSVDRLRHTYAISKDQISQTLLLRIAKEAGLRAQVAPAQMGDVARHGGCLSRFGQLANRNWVMVIAAGHNSEGEEALSVFDPLAERSRAVGNHKE